MPWPVNSNVTFGAPVPPPPSSKPWRGFFTSAPVSTGLSFITNQLFGSFFVTLPLAPSIGRERTSTVPGLTRTALTFAVFLNFSLNRFFSVSSGPSSTFSCFGSSRYQLP